MKCSEVTTTHSYQNTDLPPKLDGKFKRSALSCLVLSCLGKPVILNRSNDHNNLDLIFSLSMSLCHDLPTVL